MGLCATEEKEPPKPLYERLGGQYAIAELADKFLDKAFLSEELNKNSAVAEAHKKDLESRGPGESYARADVYLC